MKILAVESSAKPASCAICDDRRISAYSYINTNLKHSQTLIPMIHSMLKNSGIGLNDIDLFAVAAGPGSYTGVRIGVSAVNGMAFERDIPCVGVSTLAAMARMTESMSFDGIICSAMDARCKQVYTALFECRDGIMSRLTKDDVLKIDQLINQLSSIKKSVLFIGDGAELCYNALKPTNLDVCLAPESVRLQNAVGVALEAAAVNAPIVSGQPVAPIYLRLSQAERELNVINAERK